MKNQYRTADKSAEEDDLRATNDRLRDVIKKQKEELDEERVRSKRWNVLILRAVPWALACSALLGVGVATSSGWQRGVTAFCVALSVTMFSAGMALAIHLDITT